MCPINHNQSLNISQKTRIMIKWNNCITSADYSISYIYNLSKNTKSSRNCNNNNNSSRRKSKLLKHWRSFFFPLGKCKCYIYWGVLKLRKLTATTYIQIMWYPPMQASWLRFQCLWSHVNWWIIRLYSPGVSVSYTHLTLPTMAVV